MLRVLRSRSTLIETSKRGRLRISTNTPKAVLGTYPTTGSSAARKGSQTQPIQVPAALVSYLIMMLPVGLVVLYYSSSTQLSDADARREFGAGLGPGKGGPKTDPDMREHFRKMLGKGEKDPEFDQKCADLLNAGKDSKGLAEIKRKKAAALEKEKREAAAQEEARLAAEQEAIRLRTAAEEEEEKKRPRQRKWLPWNWFRGGAGVGEEKVKTAALNKEEAKKI